MRGAEGARRYEWGRDISKTKQSDLLRKILDAKPPGRRGDASAETEERKGRGVAKGAL